MKQLFTLCLLLHFSSVFSQSPASFDIASFNAPKGWQKTSGKDVVSYSTTSKTDGGYCVIAVYKSAASLGSLDKDYNNDWKELVADRFTINGTPETEVQKRNDGWQVKAGGGAIKTENGDAIAILSVFFNGTTSMSILTLLNKEEYLVDADKMISSLKFKKITAVTKPVTDKPSNPPVTTAPGTYQFTTSNFDDGWTSTIHHDYVLVEKNNNAVYLNFSVPYNASQFSGTGIRDASYYWDNYVTRLFTTRTKQFNDGGSMALKPPYMEGTATDKRTGRSCFIGMYLVIVPNAVSVVIGTAPDETAFRRLFPKANDPFGSDLASMTKYNKFAIGAKDLTGKWQNGNTETAHWYYVSPSEYEGYAGMTLAATSATFHFNSNGTYTSIHNGATGAVGNMSTFQQEYKGNYSVNNWIVTATNRYGGKTDKFDAYFVVVRGGRLLKLNDNAGGNYTLVKVK